MTDLAKLLAEATKGPWRCDITPMSRRTRYITRFDGRTIGSAHSLGFFGSNDATLKGRIEADANARLFVLAPDLAAALLKAEVALREIAKEPENGVLMMPIIDRHMVVARSALSDIAKLTGGTNV